MINLIRNELYKIFHKKGIYISLLVVTAFVFLTNFIYNLDLLNGDTVASFNSYYDTTYLKELEEAGDTKSNEYISAKTASLTSEYFNSFEKDSWQRYAFNVYNGSNYYNELSDINYRIVYYEVRRDNKEDYEKAKKEKELFEEKIKNMSWQDFVKEEKKELEESLKDNQDSAYYTSQIEGIDLRLKYNIDFSNSNRNQYVDTYVANRSYILEQEGKDKLDSDTKEELERSEAENKEIIYRFENNIKDYSSNSNNGIIENFYNEYFLMILIIIIIVSGSIVSEEFSKGTIKLLLVKPYSRTKILLSKYITSLLMIVFAIVFILLAQLIIGGIFFGYDTLAIPKIVYNFSTNMVMEMNIFKYFLYTTVAILPQFILLTTLAFSLSTLFLSTSLANTLTIIGSLAGDVINALAVSYEINILKLFVTLNWDFTPYLFGGKSPYLGITLSHSIIVCIVYWLIMIVTTFIVFKRRNIKNV